MTYIIANRKEAKMPSNYQWIDEVRVFEPPRYVWRVEPDAPIISRRETRPTKTVYTIQKLEGKEYSLLCDVFVEAMNNLRPRHPLTETYRSLSDKIVLCKKEIVDD